MSETKKIQLTVGEFKKLLREATDEMESNGTNAHAPSRGDTTNSELQMLIEKTTLDLLSKLRAFMSGKGVNPNEAGFDELALELQRKIGQAVFGYFISHKGTMGELAKNLTQPQPSPMETNERGEMVVSKLDEPNLG